MYVCMYVCMYVYIYIYTYIYTHICIHLYDQHTHTHSHTHRWSWGDNTYGQCGVGSVGGWFTAPRLVQQLSNVGVRVVVVAAGLFHSAAGVLTLPALLVQKYKH